MDEGAALPNCAMSVKTKRCFHPNGPQLNQKAAQAFAQPCTQLLTLLPQQAHLNVDETGTSANFLTLASSVTARPCWLDSKSFSTPFTAALALPIPCGWHVTEPEPDIPGCRRTLVATPWQPTQERKHGLNHPIAL